MAREQGFREALLSGRDLAAAGGAGIGDDALVLPAETFEGGRVVLTTDALEEGVHFRRGWQGWEELGPRLLAVNLSDLAAVGARPVGCLLAVSWPEDLGEEVARRVGAGLLAAEREHGCPLLGGDTDVGPSPLRLSLTAIGTCASPVLRSGGREGDLLFVSGPLGGAAAAVARLLAGRPIPDVQPWTDALRRFRLPEPRLELGRRVASSAHALIDLSDGLRPDLERLALASRLSAEVELRRVPVHPAAAEEPEGLDLALQGGEDYELLIAGPEALAAAFPDLTRVGRLVAGPAGHVEWRR